MELKNVAAGVAITATGVATGACVFAAATATATAAAVGFGAMAIVTGSFGVASMTAWVDPESKDAPRYFERVGHHAAHVLPAAVQFIGQTALQALVQGATEGLKAGVKEKIEEKISGKKEKQYILVAR